MAMQHSVNIIMCHLCICQMWHVYCDKILSKYWTVWCMYTYFYVAAWYNKRLPVVFFIILGISKPQTFSWRKKELLKWATLVFPNWWRLLMVAPIQFLEHLTISVLKWLAIALWLAVCYIYQLALPQTCPLTLHNFSASSLSFPPPIVLLLLLHLPLTIPTSANWLHNNLLHNSIFMHLHVLSLICQIQTLVALFEVH